MRPSCADALELSARPAAMNIKNMFFILLVPPLV
jgi:hypothetical protein